MDATDAVLRWDIFCHVVDNFGDIGGAWRLACGLAERGQAVRLFADDTSALSWMAPGGLRGVQVRQIAGLGRPGAVLGATSIAGGEAPDVVIAAFGCVLPDDVLAAIQHAPAQRPVTWIQHEYLSAEAFVARSHGLASPVHGGAPAGVHRWFYFPGFTPDTGGLLREAELATRRARFDRAAWLAERGVRWSGEPVVSVFCYEPAPLAELLLQVAAAPARLLVAHGRSAAAVETALAQLPAQACARVRARLTALAPLSQPEFDALLWAADLNFVRGEDSLVRALWAGTGFVWQAYPQDDAAHHAKIEAFLDWLRASPSLRRASSCWNRAQVETKAEAKAATAAPAKAGAMAGGLPALFEPALLEQWRGAVSDARARLLAQDDLVTRLLRFVAEKR